MSDDDLNAAEETNKDKVQNVPEEEMEEEVKQKHVKRKRYSNSHKRDVARRALLPGGNISAIAREEGLPESTVRSWVQDFDRLDSHVASHGDLKTIHRDKIPTLTSVLLAFCEQAKFQEPPVPLTSQVISSKAAAVANDLLKEYEQNDTIMDEAEAASLKKMTFSTSWACDWAKRNQLWTKKTADAKVHPTSYSVEQFTAEISNYQHANIYCLTDTRLFYRILPRQSYVLKSGTNVKSTNSMKFKDRVVLYVCTNATGSQKVPLAMIGQSKNPRILGMHNRKEKFKYFDQSKVSSDTRTYRRWFHEVFLPHIRSLTKEKILLIVPFVSDEVVDENEQVKTVALPPRLDESIYPPLSMGVVAALKRAYRYNLLNEILFAFENREQNLKNSSKMLAGTAGLAEGREPHLLNAMEMLDEAWKSVDESVINVSWAKSGVLGDPSALPYGMRSRNPITEHLQAAVDSILFGLQNLQLPRDSSQDDALLDNVRATLKLYNYCVSDDAFAKELETWVTIEESADLQEMIRQEKEESLTENEERYIETLKEIQESLLDPRYEGVVERIQKARDELLRAIRVKRITFNVSEDY